MWVLFADGPDGEVMITAETNLVNAVKLRECAGVAGIACPNGGDHMHQVPLRWAGCFDHQPSHDEALSASAEALSGG